MLFYNVHWHHTARSTLTSCCIAREGTETAEFRTGFPLYLCQYIASIYTASVVTALFFIGIHVDLFQVFLKVQIILIPNNTNTVTTICDRRSIRAPAAPDLCTSGSDRVPCAGDK